MSKAELTRARIIQHAAEVFNQFGYAGTSLAVLMDATGMKKGGIYNHFDSKEDLAIAAFDYSVGVVQQRYAMALQGKRHSADRLESVIDTFCATIHAPIIKGGCPLINTAIDSGHRSTPANEALTQRAKEAMDTWRKMLKKIVRYGQKHDEIQQAVKPDVVATIVISTLEGAVMMSGLYGDRTHLNRARSHLTDYDNSLLPPT